MTAGKQRALAKVAPLKKGQIILPLKSTALSSWAAKQETGKRFDLNCQKSKSQASPHALGCPHTPCWPPKHWPFDTEWFEESESDEVSGSGSEGPEEVLPQVSLLQGEVLVGFQAGAHLGRRVDVLFPQCLFSEVLVLGGHKAKGQRRTMSCSGP